MHDLQQIRLAEHAETYIQEQARADHGQETTATGQRSARRSESQQDFYDRWSQ